MSNSLSVSPVATATNDMFKERNSFRRSVSHKELLCHQAKMRRSYSDNHLCYSVNRIRASSTASPPKLKTSRSVGLFNFQFSGSILPNSLRSFLFDPDTSEGMDVMDDALETEEYEMEIEKKERSNWIERLVEIRSSWRDRQQKDKVNGDGGDDKISCDEDGYDGVCEVDYSDDEEQEGKTSIDPGWFSSLLARVSLSDAKVLSQLAFLCNMAYVIPEIKAEDLRRYHGLDFVTSSLLKKAEAAILKLDQDSTRVPMATSATGLSSNSEKTGDPKQKRPIRSSVAYDIAASAASYVQSRAKNLLSLGSEPQQEGDSVESRGRGDNSQVEEGNSPSRVYNSEMAAYMAASTMTSVVAAGEKEKQEAARDLRSLQSSPCDWFVCDDPSTCTRCFVIQGSDSAASWRANLFFEPTIFEDTEVLVHRGIYEASKGIYEQFLPGIMEHLNRYGDRAKFQFTGHSLGGSLSLLVNLMLLARKVVKPSALLPVVTFGSPFIFCGGQKILDEFGLDENHVRCVMMHRDIVPRAFSCTYPNHVAQVLKRWKSFRSHPCLNKNKLLYAPMGKIYILQPDEKSSPPHPLLPPGSALYALEENKCGSSKAALKAFLNSPHPLDTLSDPTAYGHEGTILRDHDSSNYLKAMNGIIRQHRKIVVRKVRKQRSLLWPLLTSQSPHAWSQEQNLGNNRIVSEEVLTSA